jgi:sarcosine oxidase subunit beta
LAALVEAAGSGRDHDNDPVSIVLPRTGHTVDLGAFSRTRTVRGDGPHNVLG